MKFNKVRYFFAEAFAGVGRNSLMSVSSCLTVACCMLILIFSYTLASNVDYVLAQLENRSGMTAFVDDELDDIQTEELRVRIASIENIGVVTLITREEALEIMAGREEDAARAAWIRSLEYNNPLPQSFEISLIDGRRHEESLAAIESFLGHGIYLINSDSQTVAALISANNVVRIVSMIVVALLAFLSVVIIVNTIKLTVNARRADINIMKYVGATDWFIKWPFVIEGMLIGLLGAIIPVLMFWLTYDPMIDGARGILGEFATLVRFRDGQDLLALLAPVILAMGAAIGIIGSVVSMRKYLRV